MAPRTDRRDYDIVLLGATGYTGALTALTIAEQLPTTLRWAIAGRSSAKLESLAKKLKESYPDRLQPQIEVTALDQMDLVNAVVRRAKVCVSTVLYHKVGETVVRACAENGTDYIDCTGAVPLVNDWIKAYHETAKANRSAIIVGAGFFSAPQDVLTWLAATELATKASARTKEVILAYTEKIAIEPSGGTVESIGSALSLEPAKLAERQRPWVLSPIEGCQDLSDPVNALGTRHELGIGILAASSPGAQQNRAFIHRSWGLLGGPTGYGPNFRYSEYERAASTVEAAFKFFFSSLLNIVLSSSFIYQYILRPMFPPLGEGPDVESQRHGQTMAMQALAIAEGSTARALAKFRYPGGSYRVTAVFLAQGAASLLYERKLLGGLEGGILTPAMLGQDLVDRMISVGAEMETGLVQ